MEQEDMSWDEIYAFIDSEENTSELKRRFPGYESSRERARKFISRGLRRYADIFARQAQMADKMFYSHSSEPVKFSVADIGRLPIDVLRKIAMLSDEQMRSSLVALGKDQGKVGQMTREELIVELVNAYQERAFNG